MLRMKKMKTLYYSIWVDFIFKGEERPENKYIWKPFALFFMSFMMSFNFWFLSFLLLVHLNFKNNYFPTNFIIFNSHKADSFFNFFISYLLPFLLINYFLIFYKNRYRGLIKKYPYNNGKLFMRYIYISFLVLVLYFIVAYIIVVLIEHK